MSVTTLQLGHRPAPLKDVEAGDESRSFETPGRIDSPVSRPIFRPLLHHVQLKTTRLDDMIEWYGLVAGLVVAFKGVGGAWLTNDDANHRLALLTSPKLKDDPDQVAHAGLHHTAWEYSELAQLLDTYARLRDHGILPHRTVNHGMVLSFYYLDPDGNSVELQVDGYGDWRKSAAFLETPEFARDPYGPGVDPEQMIAAREAGATDRELHQRSYAGEFPNVRPNDRRLPV